ncbi:50S ribosomal protein L9 [Tyzzerella sp. An114]|uniref:50S ribosomal protein L9 n=1 Tax=Tyzzerella sp. An114 TaxID=1965545 RepID=UPI000B4385D4|nr:50S ribosomal protein L9 [Tyzzerella sp. An114]OUQ58362.1 50S ribosomal protein L9 [Tyzzerella sp. An114]HIT72572.1 50S ribosomal protein L9 [Candidatus Fimicola cottocaccae]
MKVILLQDVKSVGKKGELVNVSEGYGNNFLLPKKLAVEATKTNINDLELKKKADEKRKKEEYEEALALAEKINELEVKVSVKTGDNGKIFGSVTTKEIGEALEKQHGIKIDKKKMVLGESIKMVGTRNIKVKIHPKVTAEMTVKIVEA